MLLDGFAQFKGGDSSDLEGKSVDPAYDTPKPVEVISFHHQMNRSGWRKSGNQFLPKDATHGQLTILKPIDAVSASLARWICEGVQFTEFILICRGPILESNQLVQKKLLQINLGSVVVSRFHYVGDPRLHCLGRQPQPVLSPTVSDMGPLEEVELLYFGEIKWTYAERDWKSATPPIGQGA